MLLSQDWHGKYMHLHHKHEKNFHSSTDLAAMAPGAAPPPAAPASPNRSMANGNGMMGLQMPGGYPSPSGGMHNPMSMAAPPAYTLGYNSGGYPPAVHTNSGLASGSGYVPQ